MNKRILIIDDDDAILEAIKLALELEGYQTQVDPSGEDIVQKTKLFSPNVILLDVLLSGKDGREIAKKLKKDRETKKIPIVIISAHPSAQKTIKDSGAEHFLAKPFDVDDLFKILKKYTSS